MCFVSRLLYIALCDTIHTVLAYGATVLDSSPTTVWTFHYFGSKKLKSIDFLPNQAPVSSDLIKFLILQDHISLFESSCYSASRHKSPKSRTNVHSPSQPLRHKPRSDSTHNSRYKPNVMETKSNKWTSFINSFTTHPPLHPSLIWLKINMENTDRPMVCHTQCSFWQRAASLLQIKSNRMLKIRVPPAGPTSVLPSLTLPTHYMSHVHENLSNWSCPFTPVSTQGMCFYDLTGIT